MSVCVCRALDIYLKREKKKKKLGKNEEKNISSSTISFRIASFIYYEDQFCEDVKLLLEGIELEVFQIQRK